MSTMVGLTAGASANEVGINKNSCAHEVTRSVTAQSHLRQPTLRSQLLNKYQQGKFQHKVIHRREPRSWNPNFGQSRSYCNSIDQGVHRFAGSSTFNAGADTESVGPDMERKLNETQNYELQKTDDKKASAVTDYVDTARKSEPRIITDKRRRYLKFESPYE